MKNYHNIGIINPERVYDSLHYLVKNHSAYKDINIEKKEGNRPYNILVLNPSLDLYTTHFFY